MAREIQMSTVFRTFDRRTSSQMHQVSEYGLTNMLRKQVNDSLPALLIDSIQLSYERRLESNGGYYSVNRHKK